MTALPAWMRPPADAPVLPEAGARSSAPRRALGALMRVLGDLLDPREADRRGLLQALDPRAKAPLLIGCVVLATLLQTLPALLAAYGLALALALLSRIPPRRFGGAWLMPPAVTALVALPALFAPITPGATVATLGPLAVTDAGLYVVARFVLRALACITFTLLLVATTRPARLFHGLRALGVPHLVVMLLAMTERYLAVLARAAEEIHLAKLSRTPRPGSLRQEQAWAAAGMGALFRRTQALGADVYLAMLARGYTGAAPLYAPGRPGWRDAAAAGALVVAGTGLWLLDVVCR